MAKNRLRGEKRMSARVKVFDICGHCHQYIYTSETYIHDEGTELNFCTTNCFDSWCEDNFELVKRSYKTMNAIYGG